MRIKKIIVVILLLTIAAITIGKAFAEDKLKEGADPPQTVYARYVQAVHNGDIKTIRKLLYSRTSNLWKKSPKKMLAYTRNTIPRNPVLQSKKESHEYQYTYTFMTYTGMSPSNKRVLGQIRMIVEGGEWKVYMEVWKPMR